MFQPQLEVTPGNYKIQILFEYLAKNDGMKLQLIHSGVSDEDIVFSGKTKNSGDFRDIAIYEKKKRSRYKIGLLISGLSFFIITGLILIWNIFGYFSMLIDFIWFLITMFLINWGIDIILDFIYPSIPKDLQ